MCITADNIEKEIYLSKELGTAKPYGFNDQIKGVSTLSSTSCKKANVYALFNNLNIRGRKDHMENTPQPNSSIDAVIALIDVIDQPKGVHKIKTHLFSMSLPQLSTFLSTRDSLRIYKY